MNHLPRRPSATGDGRPAPGTPPPPPGARPEPPPPPGVQPDSDEDARPALPPAPDPRLPRLLVITDRQTAQGAGHDLVEAVDAALGAGAPAVLLRDKDLPASDRRELGEQLAERVRRHDAQLWVAGDIGLARHLDASGLHLGSTDPALPRQGREGLLLSRSCHDHPELMSARGQAVDVAIVSAVSPSISKPGLGPPLGAAGLRRLLETAGPLPVVALGGVTPDNASTWIDVGAFGVAAIGSVLGAADPAAATRAFLDVLPPPTAEADR